MKILTPYGIEQIERARTRRQRAWAWIKAHHWYVILQALCLSLAPVIIFLSEMSRGYRAFGSEVLLIVAPSIYKFFIWVIHYDDREER